MLSAELLPTSVRATGFGLVSAASRLAGTATPFVAGTVWANSPPTALACYAAAAALCACVIGRLRETGWRAMPEEIQGLRWGAEAYPCLTRTDTAAESLSAAAEASDEDEDDADPPAHSGQACTRRAVVETS